ncbi:hypothetical protein EDB83DRAFT_2322237 [Lactarius deliciosus]|nr:hypothetical protein EDB83DRAFT_2322237 [Lactarius deliciosus]
MAPPLQYFPYLDNDELTTDIHEEVKDQVWIWANVGTTYIEANDLPKSQMDMEGTATISLNRYHELRMTVPSLTSKTRNHKHLANTGVRHMGRNSTPWKSHWKWEVPACYQRFTLDAEERPIMLGSEGYGSPIFSQGLYAHDQPKALHQEGNNDLQFYTPQHPSRHKVDKALVKLADLGVCADVLRHCQATTHKNKMLGWM